MNEADHFREKQRQCLRLIKATTDRPAIESMTALAREFEAKAQAAEASAPIQFSDGEPSSAADQAEMPLDVSAAPDEGREAMPEDDRPEL